MTQNSIKARLTRLLDLWPKDNIRPASVSVPAYLQSHIDALSDSPSKDAKSKTQKPPISPASLVALNTLLENQYARRYPLPTYIKRPASNPDYYQELMKEFDEAPKRDWWGRLIKAITGKVRIQ